MPEWLKSIWTPETKQMFLNELPTLAGAIGILIGGWLAAHVVKQAVFGALKRTTLDDRVAEVLGVVTGKEGSYRVEQIVARTVYYILLLVVMVWFFSFLGVDAVTAPMVTVLNEFAGAVPNLAKAVVLGFVGFLLATGLRKLIRFALDRVGFEARMQQLAGEKPTAAKEPEGEGKKRKKKKSAAKGDTPLTNTLGDVAYWVVIVVTAIPVLEALQIGALAAPLSTAFSIVTTYLPKIAAAAVLLVAGFVLARIARAVVSGVLERVGLDRAMTRLGFGHITGDQKLSGIIGTLLMAFILLQFAISAVGRLEIKEISEPLGMMLHQVYAYLPKLLVGGVLLAVGVMVARVASNVASRLLAAMGFNTLMVHIGVFRDVSDTARAQEAESKELLERRRAQARDAGAGDGPEVDVEDDEHADELLGQTGTTRIQTPSDVAGVVVGAVVVLLFLRQVLSTMQMDGLGQLLDGLIGFLPHALVAVVVLGAGMWAAGWAHARLDELTKASNDRLLRSVGTIAHVAIVAFAAMAALQQLGVAETMIALAFGIVLGAVALALALAFGLGGREVASRVLEKEYRNLERDQRQ